MVDPHARRLFGTLVAAAFVDGKLSESEKQVLHRKGAELSIPIREFDEVIAQGRAGRLPVAVPATAREREELLDDLIDVVCADGRIEAQEHHLIAKFAGHVGVALPDLRGRVKQRMERRTPVAPPRAASPPPPAPAPAPSMAPAASAPPEHAASSSPFPPVLPDIPPVTLQLIRQAILFEKEEEALGYIERMMSVARPQAREIINRVIAAFPGLKPGAAQIRPRT